MQINSKTQALREQTNSAKRTKNDFMFSYAALDEILYENDYQFD